MSGARPGRRRVAGGAHRCPRGPRHRLPDEPPGAHGDRRGRGGTLVSATSPSVVVEAVKLAEDRSGDLVVRLYEARGGRATTRVDVSEAVARAWTTDLLERDAASLDNGAVQVRSWERDEPIELTLRPFEIMTLRLRKA
ncbi:glycosyl hydrolase-related protein [Streptomyces sp. BH097]|uniref:glycosyl hydrolase-related protein n=1 Tax=unclassified Streptomyces TaxID=2593676 RepID=UPI003BB53759